jgi:thiamine kinase
LSADTPAAKALASLPGMRGARITAELSRGPTNSSYRVERGEEIFVLRLDRPEAARLGLDRANERLVSDAAAAAGLAPETVFFDDVAGVFLRRFVPGRSWQQAELSEPARLEQLARALRRLHALPPRGAAFEPLQAARRYAAQVDSAAAQALAGEVERLLAQLEADGGPAGGAPCLCHNDLVCENIVEGEGRLWLIDWEYAAVGDPLFDLAVVIAHHSLGAGLQAHFLDAWAGGRAGPGQRERLELQCEFYRCLLQLWTLRTGSPERL